MASANGYGPALTEQQQAERLRTAYALATRFDWIENLTWYEFRDSCSDAADPECRFGVVRTDHLAPALVRRAARGHRGCRGAAPAAPPGQHEDRHAPRDRRARPRSGARGKGRRRARKERRTLSPDHRQRPSGAAGHLVAERRAHDAPAGARRLAARGAGAGEGGIFWARFEGARPAPGDARGVLSGLCRSTGRSRFRCRWRPRSRPGDSRGRARRGRAAPRCAAPTRRCRGRQRSRSTASATSAAGSRWKAEMPARTCGSR